MLVVRKGEGDGGYEVGVLIGDSGTGTECQLYKRSMTKALRELGEGEEGRVVGTWHQYGRYTDRHKHCSDTAKGRPQSCNVREDGVLVTAYVWWNGR